MKYYIVRYRIEGSFADIIRYKVCCEGLKNPHVFIKSFSTFRSARKFCEDHGLLYSYIKEF